MITPWANVTSKPEGRVGKRSGSVMSQQTRVIKIRIRRGSKRDSLGWHRKGKAGDGLVLKVLSVALVVGYATEVGR